MIILLAYLKDFNFVLFTDFEIVLHIELFDPLWILLIFYQLRLIDFLPNLASLFIQNGKSARS